MKLAEQVCDEIEDSFASKHPKIDVVEPTGSVSSAELSTDESERIHNVNVEDDLFESTSENEIRDPYMNHPTTLSTAIFHIESLKYVMKSVRGPKNRARYAILPSAPPYLQS